MKKPALLLTLITLLYGSTLQAQNPYESLGVEVEVLTLSKGKYKEFHPNDTIVQIGTVMLNTITGEVVAFVDVDTVYSEATLKPELVSRWMSPDPLADEFPSWSPYNFVNNNPIRFIDPDGLAPVDPNCPGCPPPSSGSYMVHEGRQGFVDASIEYFTGMLEGMKTVLGFTEADDATVLTTGRHIDGSRASDLDYAAAGVGIFLPVSGAAAKQGFKKFFDGLSTIAAKSDAIQTAGKVLDFSIDNGSIAFKNSNDGKGLYDFVITEAGELRIGKGHFTLSNQGNTSVKGAGEIYINDKGKIETINNNSGHFQPNNKELLNQSIILRESGLTTNDFDVVDVTK